MVFYLDFIAKYCFIVDTKFLYFMDAFLMYTSKGGWSAEKLETTDQYTRMRSFDEFEALYKKINPNPDADKEVNLEG